VVATRSLRGVVRHSGPLVAGLVVQAGTSYLTLILAGRLLGAAEFGGLSALYVLVTSLATGLFLPVEQEIARRRGRERAIGPTDPTLARRAAILGLAATLALVFIAHDLAVVRHVSDRTAVMYLGKMVETAATADLFTQPSHPYTQALLSASPQVDRRRTRKMAQRIMLPGDPPSPINPPTGCRFHTRCHLATSICSSDQPEYVEVGGDHLAACHHTDRARSQIAQVVEDVTSSATGGSSAKRGPAS